VYLFVQNCGFWPHMVTPSASHRQRLIHQEHNDPESPMFSTRPLFYCQGQLRV
jgi:hypothetical protein